MASNLKKEGLKNQVKGGAKVIEGKARNAIGKVTGNKKEQRKGTARVLEGKVQKAVGKAQRKVADED